MRHGWEQYPALRAADESVEPVEDLTLEAFVRDWESEQQALSLRQRFRLIVGNRDDHPLQVA
jgi:hypothetical protein